MKTAWIRVYAELNDFLPPRERQQAIPHSFTGRTSVKDAIEAHGVPHTEIDLILVNGRSVEFSHLIDDRDRISVYPVFESIDIQQLTRLRPEPLRTVRFVLDTHLGRLAAYLRLAGFDTAYRNDLRDEDLASISALEHRILLTRDHGLLKRGGVTHGYYVRATEPRRQLPEVLRRFDLARLVEPFTRCLRCNESLRQASAEEVAGRVPPYVRQTHEEFRACPSCGRVYWKGSHYAWMVRMLERAMTDSAVSRGNL